MFSRKTFLIFINLLTFIYGSVKITNIICIELDKSFVSIPTCKLTIVQRGVVALNMHAKLLQGPVTNATLHLELLKKASGYRPFLYNITADFCKVMKNSKRFPFITVLLDIFTKTSNINHTCPYNHDIIIHELILKHEMFRNLPLPSGDYLFHTRVAAFNDWKASVKLYLNVKEG